MPSDFTRTKVGTRTIEGAPPYGEEYREMWTEEGGEEEAAPHIVR